MAEEVGFEPTVPFGTTVFETAPISRSGTPPVNFTSFRVYFAFLCVLFLRSKRHQWQMIILVYQRTSSECLNIPALKYLILYRLCD